MTISSLIEILKSRFWLVLLLPLGAATAAFFLSALNPSTYSSHATVLLDYRKPLEGELAGELLPVGMQPSYLTTQMDIIKSRPVAEKVSALLDLSGSSLWRERFDSTGADAEAFSNWIIGTLLEHLQVTVGTETRLIDVWYQDPDPATAASVANAFVDAYRETVKQLGGMPALETAESVDKLLSRLRENLEQAENRVSDYQARMGIIATDERLDVETEHLNELMREKLAADAGHRVAASRLDVPGQAGSPEGVGDVASEVIGNDLINSLQIDMSRKEGELADRSTSLGERHPQLVKLKAEVESLRQKLAAETDRIVSATRAEAARTRRLAEAAQQAEEAQRKKVLELKQLRDGLQPLLRELESARTSYDRALQVYSDYAMHSELGQTNISVLSPAVVPTEPSPSNKMLKVASAFIGGLVFAVGLAMLWELADRRVRGKEGISELGDAGYLGGLPKA
jgi:polysaccharide biosynthesis transport protein